MRLSSGPPEAIRVINREADIDAGHFVSVVDQPSVQSKGVASTSVMAELQMVDPVPDVEEAQWLSQYKHLIIHDEHESDGGRELKGKIVNHFGGSHQEWLECERQIRLQAMKAKLPKRNR